MRHLLALLFILLQSYVIISQHDNQTRYPLYPRTDLVLTYAANGSMLKIWSPTYIEADLGPLSRINRRKRMAN